MNAAAATLDTAAIQRALIAFELAPAAGLQIFAAETVIAAHHPPLQTTMPALIGAISEQASALARALAVAYPPATPLHFLSAGASTAQGATLAEKARSTAHDDWWLLPARSEDSSLPALAALIARLRAPDGCPWDRAQTHRSLRRYLLEESHEVLAALDAGDMAALRDELGDLILQILLHSQLAAEQGEFSIHDVLERLARKLIRRHPHVWGDSKLDSPAAVRRSWEALKREERAIAGEDVEEERSLLAGLPPALPALHQAQRYQERAATIGFDARDAAEYADKLREELAELAAASGPEREAEFGDLLFTLVNWGRWLGIEDAESALRAANQRFRQRFAHIEKRLRESGRRPDQASLQELDTLWDEAKRQGL